MESCDEMMRDWLSTGVGLKPKVWSTLIAALKDVKQLTAIVEEIEQDIIISTFLYQIKTIMLCSQLHNCLN